MNSLPSGANIEFTGVAIRDLAKRVAVRPKNVQKTNYWMGRVDAGGGTYRPDMRPGAVSMRTAVTEGETALGNGKFLEALAKAESASKAAGTVKEAVEAAKAAKK